MARAPAASASPHASASRAHQGANTKNGKASSRDLMADARIDDLEEEVRDGPAANWEVAYVWSFVEKYLDVVDWTTTNPVVPNVMALEQALLDCSPALPPGSGLRSSNRGKPPPLTAVSQRAKLENGSRNHRERATSSTSSLSSLEDDEVDEEEAAAVESAAVEPIDPVPPVLPADTPVPTPSPLIREICEKFQENLKPIRELSDYHGKKTWFHFLINFVSNRFNADPYYRGGFRWLSNLLRTKGLKPGQETEDKFWVLRWEDKIHLMRIMVDYQLAHAPIIRDAIKDNYDLGAQRIARRDPKANELVVLPAGRTATGLTLYHLDSSPRLYASCDAYEPHSAWICLSSTLQGYKAFVKTLAAPTRADQKAQALRGPFARAAAAAAAATAVAGTAVAANGRRGAGGSSGKRSRGGREPTEDRKAEERITRARLEADLVKVLEYEEAMDAIEQRKSRAAERAANRDARVARTLQRLSYMGTSTRSSRLRAREESAQRVQYRDPSEGEGEDEGEDEGDLDADQGRRKRRRTGDADVEGAGSVAGDEEEEEANGGSGNSRRSSNKPTIPGERKSNRLQLRDQPNGDRDDDNGDGVEADENPPVRPIQADEEGTAAGMAADDEVQHPTTGEEANDGNYPPSTVPATPVEGDAPAEERKPDGIGRDGAVSGSTEDDKEEPRHASMEKKVHSGPVA